MKILSTLVALLIAFTSVGQDQIDYKDFKFYQNGSEISLEEVKDLTKQYRVARIHFRQGRRDFAASKSTKRAIRRNLTYAALTYSASYGALMGYGFALFEYDPVISAQYIAAGTISAGGALYFQRILATKRKFKERADDKFQITAMKLNSAINY